MPRCIAAYSIEFNGPRGGNFLGGGGGRPQGAHPSSLPPPPPHLYHTLVKSRMLKTFVGSWDRAQIKHAAEPHFLMLKKLSLAWEQCSTSLFKPDCWDRTLAKLFSRDCWLYVNLRMQFHEGFVSANEAAWSTSNGCCFGFCRVKSDSKKAFTGCMLSMRVPFSSGGPSHSSQICFTLFLPDSFFSSSLGIADRVNPSDCKAMLINRYEHKSIHRILSWVVQGVYAQPPACQCVLCCQKWCVVVGTAISIQA